MHGFGLCGSWITNGMIGTGWSTVTAAMSHLVPFQFMRCIWAPGGVERGGRWLNYREIAPLLSDYLKATAFTHVEFLPLCEHPFLRFLGLSDDRLLCAELHATELLKI